MATITPFQMQQLVDNISISEQQSRFNQMKSMDASFKCQLDQIVKLLSGTNKLWEKNGIQCSKK